MGLINRISDVVKGRKTTHVARQEMSGQVFLSPLCSTYENIFPQVRPLIDALKEVRPYGVSQSGRQLPITKTPELATLDDPNDEMGWSEFMDLAFAMWLTESELNIHVWLKGRDHVYGYTILPPNCRVDSGNGEYYYQIQTKEGSSENLMPSEVMSLRYSRNPRNIQKGVSPAQTVFVQTQIADLMYQYQRAFLENGAVPAYITIIRASTKEKFEEAKREMEHGFKGADKKGKTLYLWRQYLPDGSESDQVEIKTIQPNNSTLAIKEIISIVKDDFNKAFGVSEFILGNDSSAKYDNAELSQQQFMLHRVKPALASFWSQFQHELDRITGGLGYAIDWDLEIPELTDRLKVKAEISQKNVENLTNLITSGATARAAVMALELNEEWLDVAAGIQSRLDEQKMAQELLAAEPSQEVDQENTQTAENRTDLQEDMNTKSSIDECRDHNCAHTHDDNKKIVPSFTAEEIIEKAIYDKLSEMLSSAIHEALGEGVVLSEDDIAALRDQIVSELIKRADDGANDSAKAVKGQVIGVFGDEIDKVLENGGFHVSDEFKERIQERTRELVSRFNGDARETVKAALEKMQREGMSAKQIEKELSQAMPKARAATIARNETNYAFRAGHLENDKYLAEKYGLKLRKIWRCHHDENTCTVCAAMDGETVELSEAFADSVQDKDGITYSWERSQWNDNGEIPSAHVNCRCYFETVVVND